VLNRRELEPVGRLSDEPAADTLAEVVSMCSASDGELRRGHRLPLRGDYV